MHDSFWEHCVCCCCNNAFICLSFSPLIWTPQVSGSDRSCAQIEFFFPYPFRFIIRSLWPTSKLNFWPLRQKAQIKQLVWDCGVSSWLGWTDREREALKAAQTGVMAVTGGQIQLCRDELWVTDNKDIQPLERVQRKVNIPLKAARVQTAIQCVSPAFLWSLQLPPPTTSSSFLRMALAGCFVILPYFEAVKRQFFSANSPSYIGSVLWDKMHKAGDAWACQNVLLRERTSRHTRHKTQLSWNTDHEKRCYTFWNSSHYIFQMHILMLIPVYLFPQLWWQIQSAVFICKHLLPRAGLKQGCGLSELLDCS